MPSAHGSLSAGQLKALSDPQRLAILRALMAQPASLSQLGERFAVSAAHIRHHLKALEAAGLVALDHTRPARGFTEKLYRATASALVSRIVVLPEADASQVQLALTSQDPLFSDLVARWNRAGLGVQLACLPLSSLDGLLAVQAGLAQGAAAHLLDWTTGQYNRPFIQRIFLGQEMARVQLFRRDGGFIVPPGNPAGLHAPADLLRPGLRWVGREAGSGVQVWLDAALRAAGAGPEQRQPTAGVANSHAAAAQAVASGRADAAVGLAGSALALGLGFVPLYEEPYELIFPAQLWQDPRLSRLWEVMQGSSFYPAGGPPAGYHAPRSTGRWEIIDA